ncbi:hypothetical protein N7530_010105 [Penicillium desertorum]|uniref:Uncharacterized protein n=1 Tax=Penicillium desertorum TaxID=1303715 RepID=A0A9X0BIT4_9EURO|nr:hypothetical protein N7530_010105 [Penicillium desertorum]
MDMIDLIYVKYSASVVVLDVVPCGPCTSRNSLFRPPSVQAESCCDSPSTRISPGSTVSSPLKSNRPTILIKPSKLLLET